MEVQVLDTSLTSFTVSVDCDPPAAAPALAPDGLLALDPVDELDGEVVPLICTSWPTCSVNFEASPAIWYAVPALSVRVKFPLDPWRQP